MRTSPLAQRAFTLIEVAIVIVIVGLMSGLVMKSERAVQPTNCYLQTQEQLAKVTAALDSFVRRNNRYPLPAGRSIGTSDVNFGHEASVATSSAIDRLATAPSASNPILFGALPFQALGLSDAFAADCWGNKLSYVVTQSLTDSTASGFPSTSTFGGIEIRSGSGATLVSNAAYAVISHGDDGYGAVAKNYSGSLPYHGWATSEGTGLDGKNSTVTDNILYTATYNRNPGTSHFDDAIVYFGKRNSNCNSTYPQTWNVTGGPVGGCSGTVSTVANGESRTIFGATPSTDYVNIICNNGVVSLDSNYTTSCGGCSQAGHGGGAVCTASACTTATMSWGTANHCSGSFAGVANGLTSTANNTNSGYTTTSSATATCNSGTWSINAGSTCTAVTPVTVTLAMSPLYPMSGQKNQSIFLSYPGAGQSIAATATASGGTGPYTYAWTISGCNAGAAGVVSNGTATFTWSPSVTDTCTNVNNDSYYTITATATDSLGGTATRTTRFNAVNPYVGNGNVYVCHKVIAGRGYSYQLVSVSPSTAANYLAQGDSLGNCTTFIP